MMGFACDWNQKRFFIAKGCSLGGVTRGSWKRRNKRATKA